MCMTLEKQTCLYAYPIFVIFSESIFPVLMGVMYFVATVLQTTFGEACRGSFHTVWIH